MEELLTKVLQVKGVYDKRILKNISFELDAGYALGIVGKNGAGKTTLLNVCSGLYRDFFGEVTLLGYGKNVPPNKRMQQVGIVSENFKLGANWTAAKVDAVYDYIYMYWNSSEFQQYLEEFHIPRKKKFSTLSLGERQKLGFAIALSHGTKLLILDEAFNGIDIADQEKLAKIIREKKCDEDMSVVMSSHVAHYIQEICDYVMILEKGEVKLYKEKDQWIDEFQIWRGNAEDAEMIDKSMILERVDTPYNISMLLKKDNSGYRLPRKIEDKCWKPNLDEILRYKFEEIGHD